MRSDYIMRLIEQVTRAMAEVAKLKQSGQFEGAQERLDAAFSAYTGMPRQLAVLMEAESIKHALMARPGGEERTQAMAMLLREQAELMSDPAEAQQLRGRANELSADEQI